MTSTHIPPTHPEIIAAGRVVRHKVGHRLARITQVNEDGSVNLRTVRATQDDMLYIPAAEFGPATLLDAVRYTVEASPIKNLKSTHPYGRREDEFIVGFTEHADTDKIETLKSLGFEIVEPGDNSVAVRVPASWAADYDAPIGAEISGRITAELARAGCVITDVVIRRGDSSSRFIATFPSVEAVGKSSVAIKKATQLVEVSQDGAVLEFKVPTTWVLDAHWNGQDTSAEAEAEPEIESADVELKETSRHINEQRERIERLQAQVEQLAEKISDLEAEKEALIEQRDSAIAMQDGAARMIEPRDCKEVCTKRAVTDSELQKFLNEGWDILHIQFDGTNLHAVFLRDNTPFDGVNPPRTARKLVQPVPGTHRYFIPGAEKAEAAPAPTFDDLEKMAADPSMTIYNFTSKVLQTRLSREQKDALIARRRQLVGDEIRDAVARTVPQFGYRPLFAQEVKS